MIYDYPLLLLSAAAPELRLPAGNQAASQPAWGSGSTFRLPPSFLPFPPPQPHPQLSFVSALYNHLFLLRRTPRPPSALFISPPSLPPPSSLPRPPPTPTHLRARAMRRRWYPRPFWLAASTTTLPRPGVSSPSCLPPRLPPKPGPSPPSFERVATAHFSADETAHSRGRRSETARSPRE